jgi:hypothetical protein
MEDAQREFHRVQAENMARIRHLEKQQEFLRRRGKDMLRRGLRTLDELDEVEEKEKRDREELERIASSRMQLNAAPLSTEELLVFDSPSFWNS